MIISMTNESLKLVQSKHDNGTIILVYIINISMDHIIYTNTWILSAPIPLSNFFPLHTQMMMVIAKVKSLPTMQCYTLVLQLVFPILSTLFVVLQKLLPHFFFSSFCGFSCFAIFYIFFPSLFFAIFQMHCPHSCNNTHYKQKTQIHCEETLNAKKLKGHLTFL